MPDFVMLRGGMLCATKIAETSFGLAYADPDEEETPGGELVLDDDPDNIFPNEPAAREAARDWSDQIDAPPEIFVVRVTREIVGEPLRMNSGSSGTTH